ncbi:hypothetical protein CEXT_373011 [Caerostris extrusa]|uniref:Uncharacterized protein n=1 Tax=Caerostris extrusa TaxID=172846 RepID=A0AAV4UBM5_CAEEX|nr:hypothetical protein CEXT_373011 [Caerostris extrusa]
MTRHFIFSEPAIYSPSYNRPAKRVHLLIPRSLSTGRRGGQYLLLQLAIRCAIRHSHGGPVSCNCAVTNARRGVSLSLAWEGKKKKKRTTYSIPCAQFPRWAVSIKQKTPPSLIRGPARSAPMCEH